MLLTDSVDGHVPNSDPPIPPLSSTIQPFPTPTQLLQGVAIATQRLFCERDFATAIQQTLASIGQLTQVDRVYVCAVHPNPDSGAIAISQPFSWVRESQPPLRENPLVHNFDAPGLATIHRTLAEGKAIWHLTRDLPQTTREALEPQGSLSLLLVPIFAHSRYWGFMGFEDGQRERCWSEDEEAVLMTLAATVGGLITRHHMEEELSQSEGRLQSFFRATTEAMLIHEQGVILDVNQAAEQLFGLSASELVGRSVLDLVDGSSRERVEERLRSLLEGEPFEVSGRHPDGSCLIAEVTAKSIQYLGRSARMVGLQDITRRKQTELALRESEEKFSKVFFASPDPISISTLEEGRFLDVNPRFLEVLGYEREEVLGRTAEDLNIWVDQWEQDRIKRLLKTVGRVESEEMEVRLRSGATLVILLSADVIHLAGQSSVLCVVRDITERKHAELELQLAAERDRLLGEMALNIRQSLDLEQILKTTVMEMRQFLQADRVFITRFDAEGRAKVVVESVDPQWPSVLGWVTDSAASVEAQAIFKQETIRVIRDVNQETHPPFLQRLYQQWQVQASVAVPVLQGEQFYGLLIAHQCSGARQWEPGLLELLKPLATQVAIAIQQAELYSQVQELNTNLEQQVAERTAQLQQKMEELQELNELKDEFLHAVSHDLRTPVLGRLLVLKNVLTKPGTTITLSRTVLERMLDSNERQLNLINSLLEAHSSEVRGITLHYESVDLVELVQSVLGDMEPLFVENQAGVVNRMPLTLPLVMVDPTQLRRVFENLLSNALNHNPPGLDLGLTAEVEGDMVRCFVQDNGVGMAPEQVDRLFDRYRRGGNNRHSTGLGLGLYLCRQVIMAHGGQIGVNSQPGQGAQFWFTIPLAQNGTGVVH